MTGNSFGLHEEPFRLTPDPRFLFPTRSVVQALSGLLTGIAQRKGLLQLTGESGTGKTAVMQKLAQDLEASSSFVFAWTHPHLPFDDLILACAEKAGLRLRAGSREDRLRSLTDKVTQTLSGAATAVILIDEAEKCSDDVLDGLLALSRIDHGMSWAWQIVLAAPLSFETRLQEDRWQSLHQDIGVRVALERLRGPEVRAYIAHRLHVAGLTRGALFTPEALSRIETYAAGIPRLVNRLCSRALAEAASMGAWSVTADMVDVAAREFSIVQSAAQGGALPSPPPSTPAPPIGSAPFVPASPAPPPAPPKTAATGAALLGSMFRQFAEESHYRTELSAAPAANETASPTAKVAPPDVAETPPNAEPAAPVEAAPPLELTEPVAAEPERDVAEPPVAETPASAPQIQATADVPPPAAEPEPAPEPVAAAAADTADDIPPPPAAEEPAKAAEQPIPEEAAASEPPASEEPAAPEEPKAAEPAAAAAPPDAEKIALQAAIAATIAASDAKTTLAAPTEEDRLVPANDAEPAAPSRLAGQMVKVAAAVVIGLAVGALGAYVLQLRPNGSDQIAAVRTTTQDTAPRPSAALEPVPTPPANVAAAPVPESPAVPAPPPTLNHITPSAGPPVPPLPPAANSNSAALIEKPATVKPEAPREAPAAPVAAIPAPPPPKPPMETPPPAPPVVSAPPPVIPAPPPAPPIVAEVPPPPPPKPIAGVAPIAPPAPPPQASIPAPPPVPAAPPAPPPARIVQTPPAPQIAAVEPPPEEDLGPPIDAIAEPALRPTPAEPPATGRALLPILPPSAPPPATAGAEPGSPSSSRVLAPILPAPAASPPEPAPPPPASARALGPILPTPPAVPPAPPAAAPAPPPAEPVTPKVVEAPLPAPKPEPPAPQIATAEPKLEPTPLTPPPVEKPAAAAPVPEKPPAVARVEPPPAPPAPAAAPAPVPLQRPTASLSSAAIDRLMLRGDEIMRTGDPAAARLFYELAAANGSAIAATAVGRTWDPVEHARLGIQGSLASSQRAAEWYRKASAAGDPDAEARLRALTAWMQRNPGR